jgi:hypothetical protein
MLAVLGDTETAVSVFAATLSFAVPLTPLSEADTVVEPAVTPIARPVEFTVATVVVAAVQSAVPVTSAVELSLYVAVALNFCVAPAETLALEGETAIDVTVLGTSATVRVEFPVIPFSEAVMIVEPEATAVASPVELIVATAALAAVQLAVAVTSAVEPSLYFAVAPNCCAAPIPMLVVDGDTETVVSVFVAPAELDDIPPHPVLAIMTESERKETGIDNRNQRQREAFIGPLSRSALPTRRGTLRRSRSKQKTGSKQMNCGGLNCGRLSQILQFLSGFGKPSRSE